MTYIFNYVNVLNTHTQLHLRVFLRLGPPPAQFLSHSQGHLTAVTNFLYIFPHIQININTHAQTATLFFFPLRKLQALFTKVKMLERRTHCY